MKPNLETLRRIRQITEDGVVTDDVVSEEDRRDAVRRLSQMPDDEAQKDHPRVRGARRLYKTLEELEEILAQNPLDDAALLATNLARIGLRAAVAAADALCVDEARVASWEARANELAALMLAADYDGTTWTGDGALVAWPWVPEIAPAWWFAFTANPDPEAQETEVAEYVATALDAWVDQELARAVAAIQLDTDGRGDEAIALLEAELWGADHGLGRLQRSEARAVLRRLVVDLPSEAGHLGGAFVAIGDDKAEQRVGQPHVPAESRAVTALLAFSHADRFVAAGATSLALECPTGEEPELQRTAASCTDDCQSSVAGRSSTPSLALVLGALVLLARRRRP